MLCVWILVRRKPLARSHRVSFCLQAQSEGNRRWGESKNYINEFIGFMKSESPRHVRQTGQRTAGDRHSFEFSAHASVYSRGFPCIFFFVMFPVSIRINYVDMHEVIILRGLLYMAAVIIYKLKGYLSHFEKSLFSHSFPHSSSRSSFHSFTSNQWIQPNNLITRKNKFNNHS